MSDVPETEREKFERWADIERPSLWRSATVYLDHADINMVAVAWEAWQARAAIEAAVREQPKPIDMVLHCPKCGVQHIDEADPPVTVLEVILRENPLSMPASERWENPPHRSHKCHGCGFIWRPADVPTNGVAAIKTKGKNDSAPQQGDSAVASEGGSCVNALDGEALARRFHDAYERLAPSFGYETRADTRAFDATSPNGRLMIAVCAEIASALSTAGAQRGESAPSGITPPIMPPSRGQSPVLFEDGYAEGWAKCDAGWRAAISTAAKEQR